MERLITAATNCSYPCNAGFRRAFLFSPRTVATWTARSLLIARCRPGLAGCSLASNHDILCLRCEGNLKIHTMFREMLRVKEYEEKTLPRVRAICATYNCTKANGSIQYLFNKSCSSPPSTNSLTEKKDSITRGTKIN